MTTIKTGVYKHMDLEKRIFYKPPPVQVCFPQQYQWEYYYLWEKTEWEAKKGVETFADEEESLEDPDDWYRAYKLEREFVALVKSVMKEREMD
jgi:hypothetical protein